MIQFGDLDSGRWDETSTTGPISGKGKIKEEKKLFSTNLKGTIIIT